MILRDNTQKNIQNLYIWLIPLVAVIKYIRWNWMWDQLIVLSIGWQMVYDMNIGNYAPFHAGLLSEQDNRSSVIKDNCMAFFDKINIFGITTFEDWEIFLTIVFNILMVYMVIQWYKRNPYAGWKENTFIYMNIALVNLYCCNISKECFQILFYFMMAAVIVHMKGYRKKYIGLLVVLFLTVLYARKYFALVGLYFVILQFLVKRYFDNIDVSSNIGRKLMIYRIVGLFMLFGVFHYFFMGYLETENEDTFNEMVSANTRDTQIGDSAIKPIFTGNQVALALDYFIKIFRLSFPVELLLKAKVTYFPMILNQVLLFMFIVRAFVKRNEPSVEDLEAESEDKEEEDELIDESLELIENYTEHESIESDESLEEEDEDEEEIELTDEDIVPETQDNKDIRMVALYLYLAFLLCSAAFEPDFGSWSRHLGCAFPFVLWVL